MTDMLRAAPAKPMERATLGEALHRTHPGAAYLVATIVGVQSPLARAVRSWPRGSIADIRGTELGLADATIRAAARPQGRGIAPAAPHRARLQSSPRSP